MAMTPDLEYFAVPLDFSKYEMNSVESDPVDEHSAPWPEIEPATVDTYPTIPFSSSSPSPVLPDPPSLYSHNTLSSPIPFVSRPPALSSRSPSPASYPFPLRSRIVATTPDSTRPSDLPTKSSLLPDLSSPPQPDDESVLSTEPEASQTSLAEVHIPDLNNSSSLSYESALDAWFENFFEEVSKKPSRIPDPDPTPLPDDTQHRSPSPQPLHTGDKGSLTW